MCAAFVNVIVTSAAAAKAGKVDVLCSFKIQIVTLSLNLAVL